MTDHVFALIVGAYVFGAGAYVFALKILLMLFDLRKVVANHYVHRLADIERRLHGLDNELPRDQK